LFGESLYLTNSLIVKGLLILSIIFCLIACKQERRKGKEVIQNNSASSLSIKNDSIKPSTIFDPDGYYFPTDSLRYKQFKFNT